MQRIGKFSTDTKNVYELISQQNRCIADKEPDEAFPFSAAIFRSLNYKI